MQKHDYTQNTIASISDAITNSKNTVENGVLSIEGMAYPWDAGIIHNVVTWFEVLEILGLKEQLEVAFEGADGKFSGVVQKIGKADSNAANAMNNPLNTLLAIKEKADVIQENSLKPVNVAGIFSGLHSTIWSIDEKYNKLDFDKMTDEEKKAYYETLMAKEELTEEDKKKIQDYLDYLQGKFTVDDTITDEEKYFIDLYEKLHPDEAKAIGTFFENSSKDGIGDVDKQNIKYTAYTSKGNCHRLFFKYIEKCNVANWNNAEGSYYHGNNDEGKERGIYLKIQTGDYGTLFHEIGHQIDDCMDGTLDGKFYSSKDDTLHKAMVEDVRKAIVNAINSYSDNEIKLSEADKEKILSVLMGREAENSMASNIVLDHAYRKIYEDITGVYKGYFSRDGKYGDDNGILSSSRIVSEVFCGVTNNALMPINSKYVNVSDDGDASNDNYGNRLPGHPFGYVENDYYYKNGDINSGSSGVSETEFTAEYFRMHMTGNLSDEEYSRDVLKKTYSALEEKLGKA